MRVISCVSGLAVLTLLAGCAGSTGIYPSGPGVFSVSEMRAPALGGGLEAERAAKQEAAGFCGQWGTSARILAEGPSGYGSYGPNSYAVTFGCVPPAPPAAPPAGPAKG